MQTYALDKALNVFAFIDKKRIYQEKNGNKKKKFSGF